MSLSDRTASVLYIKKYLGRIILSKSLEFEIDDAFAGHCCLHAFRPVLLQIRVCILSDVECSFLCSDSYIPE